MNVLIPTASATAGLIGGYSLARSTGVRAVGGIGLLAGGAGAFYGWNANRGPATAAALTGVYLGAFGYSHALAKKIGAWPSVYTVTGATALASLAFGGPKKTR